MSSTRMKWTAVALFAAMLTVGEAIALQAAARDARRWMASEPVRNLRHAGETVVAAVTGKPRCRSGDCVVVKWTPRNGDQMQHVAREVRTYLRESRRMERLRVIRSGEGI